MSDSSRPLAERGSGTPAGEQEPTAMSDAGLVVAIARWRHEALAEAFRRHAGSVFALAQRVLRDHQRAQDVTQVVFQNLWENAERFDPGRGSLRSYLLTMAHRRAVDIVRSEGSRAQRERRVAAHAESPYDVEHEVWDLAVADSVRRALGGLPDAERTCIEMAYFGGHTYRHVAVLTGQPEGTVKTRIRQGLLRLRTALADDGINHR